MKSHRKWKNAFREYLNKRCQLINCAFSFVKIFRHCSFSLKNTEKKKVFEKIPSAFEHFSCLR